LASRRGTGKYLVAVTHYVATRGTRYEPDVAFGNGDFVTVRGRFVRLTDRESTFKSTGFVGLFNVNIERHEELDGSRRKGGAAYEKTVAALDAYDGKPVTMKGRVTDLRRRSYRSTDSEEASFRLVTEDGRESPH